MARLTWCWGVVDKGRIRQLYRSPARAKKETAKPTAFVVVPAWVWNVVWSFTSNWLAYRDTNVQSLLTVVSWSQVTDSESLVRRMLRQDIEGLHVEGAVVLPQDDTPQAMPELEGVPTTCVNSVHDELKALRTRVMVLQLALEHAQQQPQAPSLLPQHFDGRQTLGYMNAAAIAPANPVQAYREGLLYAVQLVTQLVTPKPGRV